MSEERGTGSEGEQRDVAKAAKMQQGGCLGCLVVLGIGLVIPWVGVGLAGVLDLTRIVLMVVCGSMLLIGTLRLRTARKKPPSRADGTGD